MNGQEALISRARIDAEETVTALAARQHGVITRAQLLEAGVSAESVERRVKRRRLLPIHRGVYLIGVVMPPLGHAMAAVLACGARALVSERSAAVIWGVATDRDRARPIDVSLRGGDRRRPGIRIHRTLDLCTDEVTTFEGIPITTPARTLLDLAATAADRELARAVAEALARRLTTEAGLLRMLERHPRRPGVARLRALLGSGLPPFTRSKAEDILCRLVRAAKLPEPQVNVVVCGHEVDFWWRSAGLVVEVDGFAFHASARSFEGDRRRDAVLVAAGLRVVRVTWRQLVNEPQAVVARLAQALTVSCPR